MKKSYFLRSFIDATGVFVYIFILAWLAFNGQDAFGTEGNFVIPIFMLLLFIISALITSLLVLGKPILLYLEGLKKDAVILFFETLGWLVFFLALVGIILVQ
jgi:hypothetical protein